MLLKVDTMIRFFLPLFLAGALMRPVLAAATGPVLNLSSTDSTMSADMEDRPLNEALRNMAEKGIIEIDGRMPGGEPLTLHFTHLTLDEALSKIMRGYNYVVVDREKRGRLCSRSWERSCGAGRKPPEHRKPLLFCRRSPNRGATFRLCLASRRKSRSARMGSLSRT